MTHQYKHSRTPVYNRTLPEDRPVVQTPDELKQQIRNLQAQNDALRKANETLEAELARHRSVTDSEETHQLRQKLNECKTAREACGEREAKCETGSNQLKQNAYFDQRRITDLRTQLDAAMLRLKKCHSELRVALTEVPLYPFGDPRNIYRGTSGRVTTSKRRKIKPLEL